MDDRSTPGKGSNGDRTSQKEAGQPPQEQTDAQKKLHDLLATLWEQRKGTLLERMDVLRTSVAELENNGSPQSRKLGAETAHKLAGILGTFGLPQGTDLAREAELMLEKDAPLDTSALRRLQVIAAELGRLIDQRSLPTARQ